MNRILFTAEEIGSSLPIRDQRAQHMLRILKVRPGDSVEIGVIEGAVGRATVTGIGETDVTLDFVLSEESGPPLLPLTCLLGHPRPIVLKRILRDLTAVGVGEIVICGTELGERSYLKSALWHNDAYRRFLIEGASQSGATALPQVRVTRSVAHALQSVDCEGPAFGTRLFFDEAAGAAGGAGSGADGDLPAAADTTKPDADLAFPRHVVPPLIYAIGSERGWTPRERTLFLQAGWRTVGLGPRVLRVETAAVAAAVMCASALYGSSAGPRRDRP